MCVYAHISACVLPSVHVNVAKDVPPPESFPVPWPFRTLIRCCDDHFDGTASLAEWLRPPPRERKIRGSNPACVGIFRDTSDSTLVLRWLSCQEPGVIGSVLGLVSPVSACCDWMRWKVVSATSISEWQHVKLSEQILP